MARHCELLPELTGHAAMRARLIAAIRASASTHIAWLDLAAITESDRRNGLTG